MKTTLTYIYIFNFKTCGLPQNTKISKKKKNLCAGNLHSVSHDLLNLVRHTV